MLSKDIAIINGMVRTKDSLKVKDADRNLYIEKEGSNYNGYVLGVSGEYPQYIMKKHGVPLEDIIAYAKSNGLTITDLKVRDSKIKDQRNNLVGKRIIVNAGRFTNAPATVIEIGGQVTHGVNGVYAKMDTGEKVWIARPDFEFKDSKTKDASQAYIDGYTAARGAYHKGTNPIKNDPAKAAEWDRGWEDGKADKDELSAKGSGQEYIKYGSHFKDKKMKDGNGEQALDKCRHSLFPVANELALIAMSPIYEDRIRKAAKQAEQLVDEARHVLFDAI